MQARPSRDIARTTFQLLALGVLITSSFWIVRPFLLAATWATMIAVATWPLLLRLQAWLGGRRFLAVGGMTLVLLLILVVPLYLGSQTIVENADRIADWTKAVTTFTVPQPPAWVAELPLVGAKLAERWQEAAAARPEELAARIAPYAREVALWFVGQMGSIGLLLVHFLLTVIIAAILYANGEAAARGADLFARSLAGTRGENAVHLAGQAIRGVALGVVVTAILQSTAAGIGLFVVGVPFAAVLTALIFMLCVAQIGPALVLIAVVIWAYSTKGAVWGTGFLVWAIFCSTFDNFLRPLLIKQGADLPLLLIFAGVIGGLLAFGVIGLFIGPVVLAVAYTLLVDWLAQETPAQEPGDPSDLPPAEVRMTRHLLSRREVLGTTAVVAGLTLVGGAGCGRRESADEGAPSGLSGIALVRAELARLLESDGLPMEAGYRTLEDGMRMIASIHHVPNVKGAMVEWWLRRRKTDEEFRMWHPTEHVHWEWDDRQNAGIAHHLIDGKVEKTKGQARDAADYFDVSRFAERGVSAAVCARGGPADAEGWGGHLVHLCHDTDYGCEVRTRLFIGDFEPAPSALMRSIALRFVSDERARWLMRHQAEEYVYLSQFLPALYAREAV